MSEVHDTPFYGGIWEYDTLLNYELLVQLIQSGQKNFGWLHLKYYFINTL